MEKAKELQNEILNLKNIVITSGPALGRNYTILEILKNNSLDFEVIEINEKTSLESILPKNDKITV